MSSEVVSSDASYYHGVAKCALPTYAAGASPAPWMQILVLRGNDRRLPRRRFARADRGTMYFADSLPAVRAELRLGITGARGKLGAYTGPGTTPMFWFYEVRIRDGCPVLSMVQARNSTAAEQAFALEYGCTPAACLDPNRYDASQSAASRLPDELRGVSYPSVRQMGSLCLAMYSAVEDAQRALGSGEL